MRFIVSLLCLVNKLYSVKWNKGLFLLFFLIFTTSQVQANDIKVITEQWPPHIKLDDNGKVSGEIMDKVAAIMKEADISYSVDIYPWSRAYNYALTHENVLIFPMFKTKKREKLFHFACPLTKKLDLYFVKLSTRHDIKLTSLSDAKKYIIGLNRNDYGHNFLLKNGFKEEQQLDVNADDVSSIRKLMRGRIDLMIQSKNSIIDKITSLGINHSKISFAYKLKSDAVGENCIAFSKGTRQKTIDKVKASLTKINNMTPLLDINN